MQFNSIAFLLFFAVFLPGYFASRGRRRLLVCLIGSYVFYAWADPRMLLLLIAATGFDYFIGRRLEDRKSKALVALSVCLNLGILGLFKYFQFFAEPIAATLSQVGLSDSDGSLKLILPLGLSFYTFRKISYIVDIYRGKLEAEGSLLRFAVFVALFPQLVAGPIVRGGRLLPQLREDQAFRFDNLVRGTAMVVWGYVLKICLANTLGLFVGQAFAKPEGYSAFQLLLATIFYAFQIYGDFAGYSYIAIGLARILGYDFGVNFDRPYFSADFSEFWRRWHISLSTWLRDYLYIPLGGNRGGGWKTFRNLMITMLLGGIWHGDGWTFLIWGGLHGLYLVGQRLLEGPWQGTLKAAHCPPWLKRAAQVPLVFGFTCFAWIFFRAPDLQDALVIIRRLASPQILSIGTALFDFNVLKGIGMIGLVVMAELASFRLDVADQIRRRPWWTLIVSLLLIWFLLLTGTFSSDTFIYANF